MELTRLKFIKIVQVTMCINYTISFGFPLFRAHFGDKAKGFIVFFWTCHVYGPFEFRTSLGTSVLPLNQVNTYEGSSSETCVCSKSKFNRICSNTVCILRRSLSSFIMLLILPDVKTKLSCHFIVSTFHRSMKIWLSDDADMLQKPFNRVPVWL